MRYPLSTLTLLIVLLTLVLCTHKGHADTEIWGIENVNKSDIKIQLNVDGCITTFVLPKREMYQDSKMDQMLDTAEKRQRSGCKGE